ncbi:hypothetical protein [Nocardia asiatica]|uniref:hypothetical protein n=1 Tax=Nocardia asiatica TaxID=209252 RepID=UPI0005C22A0B|nr:hypothetical protein [Nocardia asiatica]
MTLYGFVEVSPPMRFRLTRANGDVVKTQLVRKLVVIEDGRPSEDLAGFIVRLEDGTETTLGDLLLHWDETTVGLLDYEP